MAGFHYIDDLRYAVDYITYHENSRSRRRIEQDLQGKGISSATIEEAWQNWRENGGEQDEQGMIRELLRKKHYDAAEETDWKERQKIYRKPFARQSEACTVTSFSILYSAGKARNNAQRLY